MNALTPEAAAIHLMTSQHGFARVAELRQLGLSDDQISRLVRKGIFVRHARGLVGLASSRETFLARAMRYVLVAGPHAVAALWTAAQLHGLEARRDRQIHALVRGSRPRDPSDDLYVHRTRYLPSEHVTKMQGIPTTSLDRTIADCATHLDRWSAIRVLDSSNASPAMWRTIHLTAERLSNGRPGVHAIVDATSPDGADRFRSVLERMARDALRACGVPDGEWNAPLVDEHGLIREVDLAFREHKLAVEFDGLKAHGQRQAHQRDRATDRRLVAVQWRVMRFTWEDVVYRPATMAAEVSHALRSG